MAKSCVCNNKAQWSKQCVCICVCITFSKILESKDLETQSGKIVEHLINSLSPPLYDSFTTGASVFSPP